MPCMLLLRQYLKAMSVLGRTLLEHFRATTGQIMVQGLFDVSLSHETHHSLLQCLKVLYLLFFTV